MRTYRVLLEITIDNSTGQLPPNEWNFPSLLDLGPGETVTVVTCEGDDDETERLIADEENLREDWSSRRYRGSR